jgi:hypothetical protein
MRPILFTKVLMVAVATASLVPVGASQNIPGLLAAVAGCIDLETVTVGDPDDCYGLVLTTPDGGALSATDDAGCDGVVATVGTGSACTYTFSYHSVRYIIAKWGSDSSGALHSYFWHNSDSHGKTWWFDVVGGRPQDNTAGCGEITGSKWHGDRGSASLTNEDAPNLPAGCRVHAYGYYGGAVQFK